MKFKYRVKQEDGQQVIADGSIVPGVGIVRNGGIESNIPIDNAGFELIGEENSGSHLTGTVGQGDQPIQQTTERDGEL